MNDKTELFISLGAATAANCVPCFEYYFEKAASAGLSAEEIAKAVEIANKVKTGASIAMRKSVRDIMGNVDNTDKQACATTPYRPCCC
ncbi:MAG: carboxymuconolactone decarboxylase family protein [Syntrophobacteraceae bacterium]